MLFSKDEAFLADLIVANAGCFMLNPPLVGYTFVESVRSDPQVSVRRTLKACHGNMCFFGERNDDP